MSDENVIPLERIRRYRVAVDREEVATHIHRVSRFLLEVSTICAIAGRGLQFMARELGYEPRRRIRVPFDD